MGITATESKHIPYSRYILQTKRKATVLDVLFRSENSVTVDIMLLLDFFTRGSCGYGCKIVTITISSNMEGRLGRPKPSPGCTSQAEIGSGQRQIVQKNRVCGRK